MRLQSHGVTHYAGASSLAMQHFGVSKIFRSLVKSEARTKHFLIAFIPNVHLIENATQRRVHFGSVFPVFVFWWDTLFETADLSDEAEKYKNQTCLVRSLVRQNGLW